MALPQARRSKHKQLWLCACIYDSARLYSSSSNNNLYIDILLEVKKNTKAWLGYWNPLNNKIKQPKYPPVSPCY